MDNIYYLLFNEISDTISALETLKAHLIKVQQESEELYISVDEITSV